MKSEITKGKGYNKSLPSNIVEFLKDRPEQKALANKANKWLLAIAGRSFCGGTAVGKHYCTLILDINYQDGNVSVDDDIKICNVSVSTKKEFEKAFHEKYNLV